VIVLDDYQGRAAGLADWSSLPDTDVRFIGEHLEGDDLVQALVGAEVIVAMRERTGFPRSLLEQLTDLRLLVTTGMANAAIDLPGATARGVTVSGTRSYGNGTTELTWAVLLGLVKHIASEDAALRAGRWQTEIAGDLYGATLGLIGFGRLGKAMVPIANAFAMEVIAWSQNLDPADAAASGVEAVAKDGLFSRSDIVSIHTRLSERTHHLVGEKELALMKPTALLVNTSRGPIVDEAALVAALANGSIAGAALDVFDEEPLPADHRLLGIRNTVLSPHLGYASERNLAAMYGDAVDDIAGFLAGAPVRVLVP